VHGFSKLRIPKEAFPQSFQISESDSAGVTSCLAKTPWIERYVTVFLFKSALWEDPAVYGHRQTLRSALLSPGRNKGSKIKKKDPFLSEEKTWGCL